MSKAVFLDRDGTLIRHVPYLHHVEDVQLLPGVGPALRLLKTAGYYLIVITNQAGVAYGYFTEEDLQRVNSHLHRMLQEEGCRIDAWYYCPHHPAGALSKYRLACDCRKPGGGLLTLAAQAHRLDLAASFTIGDRWSDVQAGKTGGRHRYPSPDRGGEERFPHRTGQRTCLYPLVISRQVDRIQGR